ncbi:viral A-type inclusion protein [Reticulomyxa filosa]|uniref:Viral A-type inclusion protein n=1 Tax=Reticulomyxa filosa TaxID=46433 RepID=X6PA65_RETFI|nr:viral A-type inclusion protein [Reticulomyxa filosa]|eukprot:ETO35023.1 viral A-type inclusion protein [Reticulomyxa filosa]
MTIITQKILFFLKKDKLQANKKKSGHHINTTKKKKKKKIDSNSIIMQIPPYGAPLEQKRSEVNSVVGRTGDQATTFPNKRRNSESMGDDARDNGNEQSVIINENPASSPSVTRQQQQQQQQQTGAETKKENQKNLSGLNEFITTYNAHITGNINDHDMENGHPDKPVLGRDISNEIEKKEIAIKAAQEFMTMVTENDALNRNNELLKMEIDDMKSQLNELTEELQKRHGHSRHNSALTLDIQQMQTHNDTLKTQIKMLQDRLDEINGEQEIAARSPQHRQTNSISITANVLKNEPSQRQDYLEQALQKLDDETHMKDQLQHELEEWRKKYDELEKKQDEFEQAVEADLQKVEHAEDAAVQVQEENIELMKRVRGMTIEKTRAEEQVVLFKQKMQEQQAIIEALHLEKDELELYIYKS